MSAGNVLTGILVGRLLGATALGIMTLQFSILFVATAVIDATMCTTLMAKRGTESREDLQDLSGQFLFLTAVFALACGGLSTAVLWWMESKGPAIDLWLAAAIGSVFPVYLIREFLRRCELAFSRPRSALALDAAAIAVQIVLIISLNAAGRLTLSACLLSIAAGNSVALAFGLAGWNGPFVVARSGFGRMIAEVVRTSKWVVVALLLFLISMQMMPWLVMADLGVEAAGWYAACIGLANAANPLVTGFINAMMPAAALHFVEGGSSSRGMSMRVETIALAVIAGGIALAVAAFAGPLLEAVYGPAYRSAAWLLVLLALSFLVRSLGAAPYIGLWALGRADRNAAVNLGIVGVSAGLALAAMPRFGVFGAGMGVLSGDLIGAAVRWVLFARLARSRGMAL